MNQAAAPGNGQGISVAGRGSTRSSPSVSASRIFLSHFRRRRLPQPSTLRDNHLKAAHSENVLAVLNELLSDLQDAVAGQRGFLITNNDRYLGHYNAALATISPRLDEIAQLTSDNPTRQAKIPRLRQLVCAKLAEFKDTIELRQTHGFDAALAVVISGRGKAAMDAIRAQI